MTDYEEIKGQIEEIIFHNEENGYTNCVIKREFDEITLIGNLPFVSTGESIRAFGFWEEHPVYGIRFKSTKVERVMPSDTDGMRLFLSSGIISGVGVATAQKIVNEFGEDALNVIQNEPEKLAKIRGITKTKAESISASFIEHRDCVETVMYMQQYGVSANIALKIHKKYGTNAKEEINNNPYILCDDIMGVSFAVADRIASQTGFEQNHPLRIKSGVVHTLKSASQNGHTTLKRDVLLNECARNLGVYPDEVDSEISSLIYEGRLVEENEFIYLPYLYSAEKYSASRLFDLSSRVKGMNESEKNRVEAFFEGDISLSFEQREAVFFANENGVLVITGGPGTGKTTVIKTIIESFSMRGIKTELTAFTGKASKRLFESTGHEAKTIHRLLEAKPLENDERSVFTRNEKNPLDADAIIVDEMSMVDILLFSDLLKAMKKGSRLIMVGDYDQLSSVGPGNVLKDIINSNTIKCIRFNKVFRQAEKSMIVTNAHRINNGEMPKVEPDGDFFFIRRGNYECTDEILSVLSTRLPEKYGYDPFNDIQVITPSRKGILGTKALNSAIQEVLNPPSVTKKEKRSGESIFREGDKVMQTKNDYNMPFIRHGEEGEGIYNGDIGIIKKIHPTLSYMEIEFDDDRLCEYEFSRLGELELAYALTVHKTQGCEFKAIIIPSVNFAPLLMRRNLLYTAVTRAKELAVLIGNEESLNCFIRNNHEAQRFSNFKERLEECFSKI